MLLWLLQHFSAHLHALRVFNYLTLRSIVSALTALLLSLCLGPVYIRRLGNKSMGQVVRGDGPSTHFSKAGTPTMGGALIILVVTLTVLLWGDWNNRYVWLVLAVTVAYGLLGFVDDYKKIILQSSAGVSAKTKLIWQCVCGLIVVVYLYMTADQPAQLALTVPFFKHVALPLGWGYIPLSLLVIVGSSNAVNLTDGLDGLAVLPTVMVMAGLGIFAYSAGNAVFSRYLEIPNVAGVGELAVFCSAVIGSGLGFLWYNTYPAQVFMGDVGALGLGAALGTIAVIIRQELVLFIMGGVFVLEVVSVVLQVTSFRLTGKRIFKMAPIHHHFELKGWPEPRITVRFWIITFILVLCGLATLKLR